MVYATMCKSEDAIVCVYALTHLLLIAFAH